MYYSRSIVCIYIYTHICIYVYTTVVLYTSLAGYILWGIRFATPFTRPTGPVTVFACNIRGKSKHTWKYHCNKVVVTSTCAYMHMDRFT